MIGYIISIIGTATVLLYYFIYVKPKKLIQQYRKKFEQQGFRVRTLPISPLNASTLKLYQDGFQKYDNSLKHYIDMHNYDVLLGNILTGVQVKMFHPQLMQQFCNGERKLYYQKDKYMMSFIERAAGKGIFMLEGEMGKKKRKVLNSIFNFNFIAGLTDMIKNKCEEAFEIQQQKNTQNGEYVYSIKNLCIEIASSIVVAGFLGGNLRNEKIKGQNPTKFLMEILELSAKEFEDFLSLILGVEFLKLGIRKKDRILNEKILIFNNWILDYIRKRTTNEGEQIRKRKEEYIPKDIISAMLLQNQNNKVEEDNKYSEMDLLGEFKTFFVVGTDTTKTTLQAMIYFVFKNQKVEKKLREQISQKVLGIDFTYEDIKNMKYLQAIQKETIRLVGPGNQIFTRIAVKDHYLKGIEIRKGCIVTNNSIAVHYSSEYYKQPSQFRPERWLNGECDKLHPFAYNGFHGGPRSCIGKHLALLQTKIALIMFTLRYQNTKILCQKLITQNVFSVKDFQARMQK